MVSLSLFKAEPGVAIGDDQKTERDDIYQEYQGKLWNDEGPKPEDVAQGYIGDCYLMAGMMSVCISNPGAIKKLFEEPELDECARLGWQ